MLDAWWNSLGTALQVYYGVAIVTTFLLLLQLVMAMLGFDGDADVDTDMGVEVHDAGLSILSVRSVTAFFAGFGWGGVVAIRQGASVPMATFVAVASGSLLMAAVVALMRGLYAMRASGNVDYKNAIGAVGNVYLPIPPAMEGPGQVEVLVQGRLAVVQAFTRAARRLPNRERVRVVDTLDPTTLIVEPLTHDLAASSSAAVPPAGAGTT
jgi:hypothetical protein